VRQLVGPVARVERDDDRAEPRARVLGEEPLGPVRKPDRHRVAAADPERREAAREPVHARAERGEGDAPRAAQDRLARAVARGESVEHGGRRGVGEGVRRHGGHSAWKSVAAFLWATRSATSGGSSPRIRRVHTKSRSSMAGSKRRGAHTSIPIRKRSGIFTIRAFHAGSSGPVSVASAGVRWKCIPERSTIRFGFRASSPSTRAGGPSWGAGSGSAARTRSGYLRAAAAIHAGSSFCTPPTPSSSTLPTLFRFIACT